MVKDIRLKIGNLDTYFERDELSVLFFYAETVNPTSAENLFYTVNKVSLYKLINNLYINTFSLDEQPAYWNIVVIQQVISFIDSQLIPSLQGEAQDMWQKFGGLPSLINQINQGTGWKKYLSINSENYISEYMDYYIEMANEIKTLLQKSLVLNIPILVSYED